jgi:anti-anti-sigma factor
MRLNLISHNDQITRLECEGDVTYTHVTPEKNPLEEVLGSTIWHRCILLSLEKTTYIDSSGVSWLLHAHRQSQRSGGRLILHSLSPMVEQVLRLLKLLNLFTVSANEPEALQLAQRAKT